MQERNVLATWVTKNVTGDSMVMLFGGSSMHCIGDRKSLQPFRKIWLCLASNQRYSRFIAEKDRNVFVERLENEGLPFLTIALPSLGKALDIFHSSGEWVCPPDFGSDGSGVPFFLGNAIKLSLAGDSQAVECVRQLTLIFYKLEVDYDQKLLDAYLGKFQDVDRELQSIDWGAVERLVSGAKRIVHRILSNEDPKDIRPCHGTGATACHTPNYEKWRSLRYYPKLDAVFSYPDYFFFSYNHLVDDLELLLEAVESDPVARVSLVPKDSRGPRVISCEPAELMYIQQGLMRKLYSCLETHPLTRGYVNFVDQGVNQSLAQLASINGEWATLDLIDASDRVSLQLVRRLFPPRWVEAFEACRSERTVLPNGKVVELNKFAPMGSACCFPVEALCFWALACASIRNTLCGGRRLKVDFWPEVFVYGDDIICHTFDVDAVVNGLNSVGLSVNSNKSFVRGPFRESCGGDYHLGVDVTPVRVRKVFDSSVSSFATSADLCNEFIAKFGYTDSRSLVSVIEEELGVIYPRSKLPLPGTIFHLESVASNEVFFKRRWRFEFQRYEYRIPVVRAPALARCLPAWSELLRKELTRGVLGEISGKYGNSLRVQEVPLEPGWYVDPHSTLLKWAWVWLG